MHQNEIHEAHEQFRSPKKKRKSRKQLWIVAAAILTALVLILIFALSCGGSDAPQPDPSESGDIVIPDGGYTIPDGDYYVAGREAEVPVYNAHGTETGTLTRGTLVTLDGDSYILVDNEPCYATTQAGAYLPRHCVAVDEAHTIVPQTMYVRTSQSLRISPDTLKLGALIERGEQVVVLGCDRLNEDGTAHLYRVRGDRGMGYIPPWYLTHDREETRKIYDETGISAAHLGRGDRYGGGKASNLDFFPREKLHSDTNVMPDHCYSLYLDGAMDTMSELDSYIELAKSSSINTFVVDIVDGSYVTYQSEVAREYCPTALEYGFFSAEDYGAYIQRLKDEGFYVVGRMTAFNDDFFSMDHPEYSISDRTTGERLEVSGMYWPSAFCRYAWEYKVAMSVEAVELFGFNEIQYDYVRFPDGTYPYERDEIIDYHNENNETKAQAIQRFVMYATDVLHDMGVYVSADVFGETANPYVASYGQYWPAISNVVDAISGMPYPDHYAQDGSYRPWEHPYDTLLDWGESVVNRQNETASPAVVRTWVQAYDAIQYPYNEYGPEEVWGEIKGLMDNGLTGGFITWNAVSSISKYWELKPAFDRLKE